LAQAAIESGWGTSPLARDDNNFFGIQCHNWSFGECGIERTDYYADGKPYKVRFRKYPTPYGSFIDHADFLMKQPRYDSLFANTDYVDWANGLLKAGYAASKSYATDLIATIEKNNLAQYDKEGDVQMQTLPNTIIRNRKKLYVVAIIIALLLVALWFVGKKLTKK
jgi:flagellum-specific peptidoglycan hydrolase FlgJ